jgi:hypothetical protein
MTKLTSHGVSGTVSLTLCGPETAGCLCMDPHDRTLTQREQCPQLKTTPGPRKTHVEILHLVRMEFQSDFKVMMSSLQYHSAATQCVLYFTVHQRIRP